MMLFKRPGQRTILFKSVLLSTAVQEALETYCSDSGCMFVPLPPSLDSLGEMSGVVWPITGAKEGVIEFSPQSSLGTSHESL